ncbi:MAG: phospholipase D family protein [Candidatus Omnitrophota bacterium]
MTFLKQLYPLRKKISCVLVVFFFASSIAWAQNVQVFFSPQGGCTRAAIAHIAEARQTLNIAMYSLTSDDIVQEIVRVKNKGVKTRVICDKTQKGQKSSQIGFLKSQGVAVRIYQGPGLMHNKFAVIDQKVLITGSFNWTQNAEEDNAENLLVLSDKKLIASYTKEFEHLWVQGQEEEMPQDLKEVTRDVQKFFRRLFKDILKMILRMQK